MNIRWALCLLVIASGHLMASDAPWRTATTPYYRIISQASDRDTADWMRGFDQFILATSGILGINLRTLPPLTVVIFAHDRDFSPYKMLRPNGKTANVAGQFEWQPTWSMIAMAHDAFDAQSQRTIYHEATHWLMSVDQSSKPAWFSEGIAEMFSTFERSGSKVNWAKPINEHLELLRSSPQMPLAQFLAEPSALFDRDERTDLFYAQAWAFTHFLMFSKDKDQARRQLLVKFLETFKTKSGEATVSAVFGSSLPDINREFQSYIDQRSWPYMVEPAKPAADPPALQPAPAVMVESSLGFLAYAAGQNDLAQQQAQKAITLDAAAPDAYALMAYLALQGSHIEVAMTQAEAALQRGSKDSAMYVLQGDSYLTGANNTKHDAAQLGVTLYENAINLSPRQLDYYDRLAYALIRLEKPHDEDTQFLNVGLRIYPGDDWLRVGEAAVEYRLGRRDEAMSALDDVLQPNNKLDMTQQSNAVMLHNRWLVEAMQSDIAAAVAKQDFTEARAVLSRYRDRISKSPETDLFLKETDRRLEVNEQLVKIRVLTSAKKYPEARALAKELLTNPDLPAALRQSLQDLH
jgi:tetratricopeptide (TPR) repeat protein